MTILISLQSVSQNDSRIPIANLNIILANESEQELGEPYKIRLTFDLMSNDIQLGGNNGIARAGWYSFIASNPNQNLNDIRNWPIVGSDKFTSTTLVNDNPRFKLFTTVIPNGFRFSSTPIQIKDAYTN